VQPTAAQGTPTPFTFSMNGGTPFNSGNFFTDLDTGNYVFTLTDGFGCSRDTSIYVSSYIETVANFTANPQTGAAPLEIDIENISQNANGFAWFVDENYVGNTLNSYVFDTSGVYNIELIAWQHDESCADTFSLQIAVYDSLVLEFPNVFTPNGDGINDVFGIRSNLDVQVRYFILNRWGNVMTEGEISSASIPDLKGGFYTLWNGEQATQGVYFYEIEVKLIDGVGEGVLKKGFLELR
jgi:gliding motility-associated-like protein